MSRYKITFALLLGLVSNQSYAEWTDYINIGRVEIAASGVFLVASINGLNATDCSSSQTYSYIQFKTTDEKLADRALSSAYFAIAAGKKVKVHITNCEGSYAVSNSIWIE